MKLKLFQARRSLYFRIMEFFLRIFVYLRCTHRYEFLNKEFKKTILKSVPDNNYLYAIWHQNTLLAINVLIYSPHVSMVNISEYGEILINVLKVFPQHFFVRGSSARKGRDAMHQMIHQMKTKKMPGILAVDGPYGPIKKPKYGIFKMAQKIGVPIIPLCIYPKNFWECKTWDKFRIPKPFTKVSVFYGDPIYVGSKLDTSQLLILVEKLKDALEKGEKEIILKTS